MLRKVLPICFLFFISFISNSQEKYEYFGALVLNDTLTVVYKLSLTEKNGEVKGFSITDIGGEYETKSSVFGEYDKDKKELSFRETQTIYTKTPLAPDYDFCYVNTTFKNFVFGKTTHVKANFVGLFSDKTTCIDGKIALSAVEKVEKRINKIAKKINKSKKVPDSIKQKLNSQKMMNSLRMNVLKKDQVLSMFSKEKMVKFTVYDGGKEDGDRISIFSNGKEILSNYKANVKRKVFSVELIKYRTEIVIKALNEGVIAPNTVIVEIEDGDNTIKALSNLKMGETTQIDVLRQE